MFSGVSAFDKHQTFPDGGSLTCNFPETRGLVTRVVRGLQVWGWPEREDLGWVRARRSGGGS